MSDARQATQGIGGMLRGLAQDSADLLRGEVRLARVEAADTARAVAMGTASIAIGAVLALLGGLSLVVGLVLLAGDQWLPGDRYWLAAAIVMVISGTIAAWSAMRGRKRLEPGALVPDETVETLKEDKEWLKRQMTSGATSN
jgi:uncharacterized membrane protein YqjE